MKKLITLPLLLFFLFNVASVFASFNYLEPDEFKSWLLSDKPIVIADIQVKDEFAAHHFTGSVETNAFPVKSEDEKKRMVAALEVYKKSGNEVVVVCPRGGGGAKRAYTYLKDHGVPEEKLFILKGGVEKWPYRDMLVSK